MGQLHHSLGFHSVAHVSVEMVAMSFDQSVNTKETDRIVLLQLATNTFVSVFMFVNLVFCHEDAAI